MPCQPLENPRQPFLIHDPSGDSNPRGNLVITLHVRKPSFSREEVEEEAQGAFVIHIHHHLPPLLLFSL